METGWESVKDWSNLSGHQLVLLFCCEGHEWHVDARYRTGRPQRVFMIMVSRHSFISTLVIIASFKITKGDVSC